MRMYLCLPPNKNAYINIVKHTMKSSVPEDTNKKHSS